MNKTLFVSNFCFLKVPKNYLTFLCDSALSYINSYKTIIKQKNKIIIYFNHRNLLLIFTIYFSIKITFYNNILYNQYFKFLTEVMLNKKGYGTNEVNVVMR